MLRRGTGCGIAAIALMPGVLIGWTVENVPIESFGVGGWLRSLAFAGVAVVAPIVCAAALCRGRGPPTFAQRARRAAAERCAIALAWALGLALIALCVLAVQAALGLVFDPRYRDFPFAPLTAAVVPFLVLAFVTPRRPGARGAGGDVIDGRVLAVVGGLHRAQRELRQLAGAVVLRRAAGARASLWLGRGPRQAEDQQRRGQARTASTL